jgi:hypothetical protein
MAIQTINIGQYANDGSGDDLRSAFTKVNANFALLGTDIPVAEATNLTTKTITVTSATAPSSNGQLYNVTFSFAALATTPTINQYYYVTGCFNTGYNGYFYCTTSSTTSITLSYTTNPGTFTLVNVSGTSYPVSISNSLGIFKDKNINVLEFNSIKSSDNSINIMSTGDGTIDLKSANGVINDTAPRLGGDLLLNGHVIRGDNSAGDIQATVYGIKVDVLNAVVGLLLQNTAFNINMGFITGNITTINLDMSYITTPIANGLDFGRLSSV